MPVACSSQEQKHGQAKQKWSLRNRIQLQHWSWVRCWNWRWFAPLPRQTRLPPLASLPDGALPPPPRNTKHRRWPPRRPRSFQASLLLRQLVCVQLARRTEASAANRSNCSSRDTWLTGPLPTRTTARAPRIHQKVPRAGVCCDTGDVEARSGTPRLELEPAGRGHRSQRHAAVGALMFAKTLLQRVLHNLAAEPVVCELRSGQQAEGSHDCGGRPERQGLF